MKICLVRCPSPFLIEDRIFPPLGLMAVGTGLKLRGHDVTIHDGSFDELPLDFSYYGFGPTIAEYSYALNMKDTIRKTNPDAKLVIGGPYATLHPYACVNDGWDCTVKGDGEIVAKQAFSRNRLLIEAKEYPLDEYPITDRSILDIRSYKYYLNSRLATTVMTSQGCPFKCAFCCKNYKTVRMRSVPFVRKEIDILYHDFGYQALAFPEDIFILNRERTEAICAHLKSLGIIWRCLVRGDMIVKYGSNFTYMMADSGCVEVGIGVESGSNTILKNINKGESVETIKKGIRMLKDVGIRVKGFFIVGLPGENLKTLDETRAFLDEMDLDDLDVKIYQPYRGTPIWQNRDKFDIDWDDGLEFEKQFYKGRAKEYYGTIRTSSLTNKQIYDAWVQLEAAYKHA